MSDADTGYGATLSKGNGADPPVYTELAEVVLISPPPLSRDEVETTHLKSPNGTKEYKPSLIEPGECKLTLNYIPGGAAETALRAGFSDDDLEQWMITFPNGAEEEFLGFMKEFSRGDLTPDGKMEATATIKVSGLPELTP